MWSFDDLSIANYDQAALQTVSIPEARSKFTGPDLPGTGVTVGVLDFGIKADHVALNGLNLSESPSPIPESYTGSPRHGTAVLSLVAMTAPGAEMVSIIDRPSLCHDDYKVNEQSTWCISSQSGSALELRDYPPEPIDNFLPSAGNWRENVMIAKEQGVNILNISLGYNVIAGDYNDDQKVFFGSTHSGFGNAIDAFAQSNVDMETNPEDLIVFVWAAGNAHGEDCRLSDFPSCESGKINARNVEILPGIAALYGEEMGRENLLDSFVAVVGIEEEGDIMSYSNRCGIAADYCIAAPGRNLLAAETQEDTANEEGYSSASGTSFAAPLVSGGLALIMDRFDYSAVEARTRLFMTANSNGIYAPDEGSDTSAIYGHGLMDLDAATAEPIGATSIVIGPSANGPGSPLSKTRLSLGTAFGTSSLHSLTGREIAAFDELAAPFWYDLGSLVSIRQSSSLSRQLQRMLKDAPPADKEPLAPRHSFQLPSGAKLGLLQDQSGFQGIAGPALAMKWSNPSSPLAISAFTTEGRSQQPPATGASLSWKPLGLSAGLLAERSSALGGKADGGFGSLSATSLFARVQRSIHTGAWQLGADAEVGVANPTVQHGMLADMQTMLASRFAVSASRPVDAGEESGRIRLSLEQPLRAERAQVSLRVPVGRTRAGETVIERWQTDFAPTGRQIDLSAWWTGPPSESGQLHLGTIYSRHPGHDEDAPPSLSLLAGYRLTF